MSKLNGGDWSVVVTMRAPQETADSFIEHYLRCGAKELFVFFDDPAWVATVPDDPRVQSFVCDDAYWHAATVERHGNVKKRQMYNSSIALARTEADWILHVDCDELVVSTAPVNDILAGAPDNVHSIRLGVLESVYDAVPTRANIFETRYFKRQSERGRGRPAHIVEECYGDLTRFTKGGIFGHVAGKCFTRTKYAGEMLPIHFYKESPPPGLVMNEPTESIRLLHFYGLSFEDWCEKFIRRSKAVDKSLSDRVVESIYFIRQTYDSGGSSAMLDLYCRLFVFDETRLSRAREGGFVVEVDRRKYQKQF